MTTKQKLAFAAVALSVATGVISGFSLVGEEARRIDVITLFFSGFAGGASLVAARRRARDGE